MAGKHTQGTVTVRNGSHGGTYVRANDRHDLPICWCSTSMSSSADGLDRIDSAEAEANAALIAEAFNVAHETGCTPAQLAEQRRELAEALKSVTSAFATEPEAGAGEDQP